jgi:O-antigen/teichoic acid export membrane protein
VVGIVGMYVLGEFWSYFGVALATVITVNISCGLILLLCFRKIKQMEK